MNQLILLMHVYPREASDGAADGSAVTGYNRSVNQGLSELGHAGNVLLLEGVLFAHQAYTELWDGSQILAPHQLEKR